jgi:hypothetical protein
VLLRLGGSRRETLARPKITLPKRSAPWEGFLPLKGGEYGGRRLAPVPIHVERLPSPLEQAGEVGEGDDGNLGRSPYFVVISTIEPRKNHPLLIQVCRALFNAERRASFTSAE